MANMFEYTTATTREFTFQFLKDITDNFSKERIIGHGGYGVVYKGVLDDGEEIALKKLHYMPGLDDKQFMNEFNNLMRAQHLNITRLVGYCYNQGHERFKYNGEYIFAHVEERVLCFEYLHGGSLDKHISDESCGLDWHTRFEIIKGVSEGLNYLHNGSKDPIYHLDLKPANILLDKNMVPKIGDFGLSRLFPSAQTHVSIKIIGTVGYMPPEYIERCEITSKFDVFSLGVIMIRIMAGNEGYSKCANMSSQEFHEHVHENWGKRMQATMSSHTSWQVKTCIKIALRCVEVNRVKRPTITEIVDELNKIDAAERSAIGRNTEQKEHTTMEKQPETQEQKKNNTRQDLKKIMKEQDDRRYARKAHISIPMKRHAQSVDLGTMGSLLPKLLHLLECNYLHADMKKDIESLYKDLKGMHAAIREVAKAPGLAMLWAKEVRELSYDVDNIIDELLPHTKEEGIEGIIPDLIREVKTRHEIRIAVNCIMEKVQDVVAQHEQRLLALIKNTKEMVGIEVPRDEVISKLTMGYASGGVSIKQLYIVSIVGMAGLGKTTLAKAVYDKVQEQFDCRAFVSLSRHSDIKKFFMGIFTQIDKQKFIDNNATTLDESFLMNELRRLLANKRYLIVINDIPDGRLWEIIKFILIDSKNGSRVLTTTQNLEVAQKAGDVYMLRVVSRLHSKELFNIRLFGGKGKVPTVPPEIPETLVHICGGVPLAIIAMASLLAEKPRDVWSKVYNSIGFEYGGSEENMRKILLLSFNDVPGYLKSCLLHLNIFLDDYSIRKETLIWMWVAEGFVREEPGIGLFEIGERYFNEFINRSLIMPVENSCHCIVNGCRVHHLVLDMISSLSTEENFVTVLDGHKQHNPTQGIAHRLAVRDTAAAQDGHLPNKHTEQIRSFNTIKCHFSVMLSLSRFELLRVLSIEECTFMEGRPYDIKYLGKLLQLRYLGLYNTPIHELPNEVGDLYYLETLDLRGTMVTALPFRVGRLSQLKCLRADENTRVPDWIGNLTSLQELRVGAVSTSIHFVKELGKLKELRELEVWFEGFDERLNKALVESLCNLDKIQVLRLMSNWRCEEANWESYVTLKQLRELRLTIALSRLPAWINVSFVPNLSHLSLDVKVVDELDVDILGYLPELVCLQLLMSSDVFLSIKGNGLFRKLRCFDTSTSFMFLPGAMPTLQFLRFKVDVWAMKRAGFDFYFPSLENLLWLQKVEVEINCRGARSLHVNEAKEVVKHTLENLSSNPTPIIRITY